MVVRSIYSSRTAPILWAIIFFYGAAATGRCVLGFSLYKKQKQKQKQNIINESCNSLQASEISVARSNTQSYHAALWSIDQSTPDN